MRSSIACRTALTSFGLTKAAAQWASTTTFTFEGSTLPTGLVASGDLIEDAADTSSQATVNHQFNTSNVRFNDGFLELVVPGGQTQSPIQCGEISTDFQVLYASVSTFAILTDEPGICNGMFFYHSDSQEIDIEWISDANSTSNLIANNGTRVMQYTNQGPHGTADSSEVNGAAPEDATSTVHEYRIDWVNGLSSFYLDGVFQQQIETNVPDTAGAWTWNAWTNGDPSFTVGPPESDAVFRIQKIVMQYNTTADAGSGQQNSTTSGAAISSPLGVRVMVGATGAIGLAYLFW